ncbi:STAS/SEC14 domain-containing protein [Mesonia aestuariivivens]|uniref:STAS/SEC14 domain-containing protein n=1 Tax=Mesonia aestuariivivens TaxID=2796128 RepID=A0ABS6VYZ1_9FLAO|nr:STAS/SEC14 domain-containing protein [Mesonia aestuariivivens]MBW2960813.1 STAS/SEC14 domain-containing protein [Mesonia aestuariivivens]
MISLECKGNAIYTIAEENLDLDDYQQLIPFLERKTDVNDYVNWYFEIKNFDEWSAIDTWKNLEIDIDSQNQLHKIAMVCSKEWQEWLTQLMKPFKNTEIKYFTQQEKKEAQNWIENL